MDQLALLLATWIGITPEQFAVYLGMLVAVANIVGRLIPDTAVGFLGAVRKVAKVVGLYVGNRVAPGVTNNTAAQAVLGFRGIGNTIQVAQQVRDATKTGAAIGMSVENVIDSIRHPDHQPGLPESTPGAPANGSIVPDQYRTDPFAHGAAAGFVEPNTKGS